MAPAGSAHPMARRYSAARRNLLPREDGVIAVRGSWAHRVLAATPVVPDVVLWCPGASGDAPDPTVAELARRARTAYEISPRTLARVHPGMTAPDVLSVVPVPTWDPAQLFGPGDRMLLVADGIEYAGNLGTLLRSVDGAGANGLVLTSLTARLTHPKVFSSSRGTVLTTPVLEYSSAAAARRRLRRAGFTVVVADPAATTSYADLAVVSRRIAFVVGSEGEGVCETWRSPDLERVAIPMNGCADSLNVAVSASILLYEGVRQQRLNRAGRVMPR
jgi:TrmH family RNA methyltransferase